MCRDSLYAMRVRHELHAAGGAAAAAFIIGRLVHMLLAPVLPLMLASGCRGWQQKWTYAPSPSGNDLRCRPADCWRTPQLPVQS
ncbi:hypothetical protein NDU88_005183 [Pleurodeles waltl]|uniref:Uncharacterized protein n=1 Tax=Pleurodeles waltl TaxID=8319 RepID=A0AAV7LNI5_PLEWA|nr:hypothetical protein NDU88_005183 [Pleurodeles waltl]